MLVTAVVLAVLLGVMLSSRTDPPLADAIEALIPNQGDEVLSQSDIGIDLISGYTAELTLNGIPIPDSQLRRVDGLNQVTFRPDPGQIIERLQADLNCATAVYWPLSQGRQASRTVNWCFTAS